MGERKDIRKRDLLSPMDRAVSDTLDEYLSRIHGISTSWAYPVDFLLSLNQRGYVVEERRSLLDTESEGE